MIEIDDKFFTEYGIGDPDASLAAWQIWLSQRKRTEDAQHRWLLARLTGKSASAVSHYVHGRRQRLGREVLVEFDRITETLGIDRPRNQNQPRRSSEKRRVYVFTELDVPSRSFHTRITNGLVREAAICGALISIHETDRGRLDETVRLVEEQPPDGAVLIRLTPTPRALDRLANRGIPTVIIHGDRLRYPAPVLANIIPDHSEIGPALAAFLRDSRIPIERPVLVALREELALPVPDDWVMKSEEGKTVEPNLRHDRYQRIRDALRHACHLKESDVHLVEEFSDARAHESLTHIRGRNLIVYLLDDFSYARAFDVLKHLRAHDQLDRDLFVALSDEVAIAIYEAANLMMIARPPSVVGYDRTPESRNLGLPSYDQGLDLVAPHVMKALNRHWQLGAKARWPDHSAETVLGVTLERGAPA